MDKPILDSYSLELLSKPFPTDPCSKCPHTDTCDGCPQKDYYEKQMDIYRSRGIMGFKSTIERIEAMRAEAAKILAETDKKLQTLPEKVRNLKRLSGNISTKEKTFTLRLELQLDIHTSDVTVIVTVPENTGIDTVKDAIYQAHEQMDLSQKHGGGPYVTECRAVCTLMNHVCRNNGWKWEVHRAESVVYLD